MPALDPGRYAGLSLESFLDEAAAPVPAPGGGSVAAVAAGLAAGLCSMAAGKSPAFPGAADVARTAGERRAGLLLVSEDAAAFGRLLEAQRAAAAAEQVEPALHLPVLAAAVSAAADVPMEIAGIAAEIAEIVSGLVAGGNVNLVGDSLVAALLASAAAEAAATLVAINLAGGSGAASGDDRVRRSVSLAAEAGAASGRARAAAAERLGLQEP